MSGAIQAIGAIGNIAQGVYNAVSQYNQNLDNRAMVAEQNKFNLDQWYRENAYNHPVNVVQRLRAAGLNPALMYEGGAGNLQSAPSPQMQSSKDIAPMMTGMPTMAELSQASLVDSQAELNRANAAEIRSRIPGNDAKVQEIYTNIKATLQGIEESAARIRNLDQDTRKKEQEIMYSKFRQMLEGKEYHDAHKKIQAEIRKINSDANISDQQFKEMVETFAYRLTGIKLSNSLTQAKINEAEKNLELIGVKINETNANIGLINANASQVGQLIRIRTPEEIKGIARNDGTIPATIYNAADMLFDLIRGIISSGGKL